MTDSPAPHMRAFDVLVGTWDLSGDVVGEATFDWLPGGFFLRQTGVITRDGATHRAVEIIGAEKPFGAVESADEVISRAYTDTGETLDYTHELDGDVLTVWGGPKGSPAYSEARFDAERRVLTGAWHWPGGGYAFRLTRRST